MNKHVIRTVLTEYRDLFTWLSTEDGDVNSHANPSVQRHHFGNHSILFGYLTELLEQRNLLVVTSRPRGFPFPGGTGLGSAHRPLLTALASSSISFRV